MYVCSFDAFYVVPYIIRLGATTIMFIKKSFKIYSKSNIYILNAGFVLIGSSFVQAIFLPSI